MTAETSPSPQRAEGEPFVVEPGWVRSEVIYNWGGRSNYRLLTYADGTARFEHRCDRGERGVIICAPALQIGNGHTLTRDDAGKATVRASVSCPDCGTHGWITDGRWADA